MAVTFDAVGPSSAGASAAGATSLSWSHTNNGNAIVAGCAVGAGTDTGMSTTATYASVTMTPGAIVHSGAVAGGFLRVFTLLSPAAGANNVAVTLTGGTGDLTGGSISLASAGSFVTQYSATGTSATATATSAGSTSGGMICAFVQDGDGTTSATAPSTSRYLINLNSNTAGGNSAGVTSPSTGSNVTTAWTVTSSQWAVIGVEVLPMVDESSYPRWRDFPIAPPWVNPLGHALLASRARDAALYPPVASLTDNFADGVIDPAKWTVLANATESGGVLRLDPPAANNYATVESLNRYNLDGQKVYAKIVHLPTSTPSRQSSFQLYQDAANYLDFGVFGVNLGYIFNDTAPVRTPPQLVDYQETTWAGNGAKSTPSISWQAGDRIVVLGIASSEFGDLPDPTATGLTFAADTPINQTGSCWVNTWTATAGANGSGAINSAGETGSGAWGMGVWVWRGSDGFGERAIGVGTTKTIPLSRRQNGSAVIAGLGDFGAGATAGAAFTPTVGHEREVQATAQYGAYVADWIDQGAAGTTSYGITGTASTSDHAKVAYEILGTGAPGNDFQLYDPVTMAWLRYRVDATTVYFDISSDGATWTNWRTRARPSWSLGNVKVRFSAGWYDAGDPDPGETTVDNVNLEVPQGVDDLVGWWDTTKIDGLADGAAVGTWPDSSGLGRHAAQTTGSLQPTYQTGELNGHPVVRFDGTDDYLATAAFASEPQPHTVFVISRLGTAIVTRYLLDGIVTTDRHALFLNASSQIEAFAGVSNLGDTATAGQVAVYAVTYNGASSGIWKNGVDVSGVGNVGGQALTGLTIGGRFNGVETLDGDVGEVIVYDRALTTAERQAVEQYLMTKWGVTPDADVFPGTGQATGQADNLSAVIAPTLEQPTGAAAAFDLSISVAATLEVAVASATAAGLTATIDSGLQTATGAASAGDVAGSVRTAHGTASATGTADQLGAQLATSLEAATAPATAGDASTRVDAPLDVALANGQALDATTVAGVMCFAQTADAAGTAADLTARIDAPLQAATATGQALDASVRVDMPAEAAQASGTADGLTAIVAPVLQTATASGQAFDCTVLTGTLCFAEVADATATAADLAARVDATLEAASASGTAPGPTVATFVSAQAQTADAAGSAFTLSAVVAPTLESASAAASALDATTQVGGNTSVTAEVALAAGQAFTLSALVDTSPQTAAAAAAAQDLSAAIAPLLGAATAAGAAFGLAALTTALRIHTSSTEPDRTTVSRELQPATASLEPGGDTSGREPAHTTSSTERHLSTVSREHGSLLP